MWWKEKREDKERPEGEKEQREEERWRKEGDEGVKRSGGRREKEKRQ